MIKNENSYSMVECKMDVVIPVAQKDVFILGKSLQFINRYLDHPKIYIITKTNCFRYFYSFKKINIICINEDELVAGLTYSNVKKCMEERDMNSRSTGWYFQQFLKMAFSYSQYAKESYVVWDSDTIPLNPLTFTDNNGKFLFNLKQEYHIPYFDCMEKILGIKKQIDMSFITEHMVISSKIMNELIYDIEHFSNVDGTWWQKIINVQPQDEAFAGFSEYETYGTYMMCKYPNLLKIRTLKTCREGRESYGLCVSNHDLKNARKYFDTISFERRVDTKPHSIYRRYKEKIFLKYCRVLRRYYHIVPWCNGCC